MGAARSAGGGLRPTRLPAARSLGGSAEKEPSSRPGHPRASFKGAGALLYGHVDELLSGVRTGGNVTTEAATCATSRSVKNGER